MKRAIAISVLVLISCAPHRAEQLPIRTYTTADGLPRDRVYKIVPDPRGFLWFCTYDGLSRFDGYEFVNYSVAQGLPHRLVYDLLITRSGDYWVATSAGIARFNPLASSLESKFKTYVPATRPDAEVITDLYEDNSATIWVGTGNGFHKLRHNGSDWQMEYVSLGEKSDEQLDVTSVVEESPEFYGSAPNRDSSAVLATAKSSGSPPKTDCHTRTCATSCAIRTEQCGSRQDSAFAVSYPTCGVGQPIVERLYTKKDGLLSEGIYSLFRTSTGWLWMATMLGLSEFSPEPYPDGGHFINYTREHGLSDAGIRTLAEDHDGNLWLGSESGGAMKITRRGFTSYSEADGLEHGRIAALGENRNGELFVITGSLKRPNFIFIASMGVASKTFALTCLPV